MNEDFGGNDDVDDDGDGDGDGDDGGTSLPRRATARDQSPEVSWMMMNVLITLVPWY